MDSPAIRTEGLSKRYGRIQQRAHGPRSRIALVRWSVPGPNGVVEDYYHSAVVLLLARPTAGCAEIFGLDTQRQTAAAHRNLAYAPCEANLWPSLTGAETLNLLGHVQGRVDAGYRDSLIERFSLDPSKKVRAYSKGNRQKVLLIAALMSRPELLILDEPTSGLDPLMEQQFRSVCT